MMPFITLFLFSDISVMLFCRLLMPFRRHYAAAIYAIITPCRLRRHIITLRYDALFSLTTPCCFATCLRAAMRKTLSSSLHIADMPHYFRFHYRRCYYFFRSRADTTPSYADVIDYYDDYCRR